MTDSDTLSELKDWHSAERNIVDAALIISRMVMPETDPDWCRQRLRELAAPLGDNASARDVIETLRKQGFQGSNEYYQDRNSALQHVLQTGEGIPISLAVVVLGVCRELDIPATGINFPSHFLVAVDGTLIDPFSMRLASEEACHQWLEKNGLDAESAFSPASDSDTALRMLNNLSNLARSNQDHARALELADHKLAIAPDALPIYLERAELWRQLGVTDMARHDFTMALTLTEEARVHEAIRQQLDSLGEQPSRLH